MENFLKFHFWEKMDGKKVKKCVVVCPQNCKSRNVLFPENITEWTKNWMSWKINNVNMCFLVLSVYKVQNRLPSRTPASNCVRAWTDTNNANEPPRFPQQEAGAVFYTKKRNRFLWLWWICAEPLTAEGQKRIFGTEDGTGLWIAGFSTLQGHFRFDEARPGVPFFHLRRQNTKSTDYGIHDLLCSVHGRHTHRKRNKNAMDVE